MANFASDQWYQITLKQYGADKPVQSLATNNNTNNGSSSVFFQNTNASALNQKWQIWDSGNDTYVLRSGNSNAVGYLIPIANASDSSVADLKNGNTVPAAKNYANITDDGYLWRIGPQGDGSYHLSNLANGTAWHLQKESNARMSLSSNITGTQPGQSFIFNSVGKIKDKAFETLQLPATNTTTSHPTETSIDLSNSSGLSSAAIGGISAAIGALVVLCIVLGILLYLRRRKRRASLSNSEGYTGVVDPKVHIEDNSMSAWNASPQNALTNTGYSPYQYPPPAVELSQDAGQIPELGAGGQAVGIKPSNAKFQSAPPAELDSRETQSNNIAKIDHQHPRA